MKINKQTNKQTKNTEILSAEHTELSDYSSFKARVGQIKVMYVLPFDIKCF